MAEVFEKPKKFTRQWFRYIWSYYKVHILSILAVVVLIVVTVVDAINTVHSDVTLNYVAGNVLSMDVSEKLAEKGKEAIVDGNGDGEVHVSLAQLNFTMEAMQDANLMLALENKIMTLFASEDEMLFIFDEMMLQDVLSMDATEGVFVPVADWCRETVSEERLYAADDGICAVNLKDSAMFKEMGIDSSDMYVAVRVNYHPEDEDLQKRYENCVSLANTLAKE